MAGSEEYESEVQRLAPHDESGFSATDVLEHAEKGDEIYVEFDVYEESGVYGIRGEVAERVDVMRDDDRMEERTIFIRTDHDTLREIRFTLVTDTQSAHNLIDDEDFGMLPYGEDRYLEYELARVHTIEVTKRE